MSLTPDQVADLQERKREVSPGARMVSGPEPPPPDVGRGSRALRKEGMVELSPLGWAGLGAAAGVVGGALLGLRVSPYILGAAGFGVGFGLGKLQE